MRVPQPLPPAFLPSPRRCPRCRAVAPAPALLPPLPRRRWRINQAARLCHDSVVSSPSDVTQLRDWLSAAFDYMAMGNYPYASSYVLNGQVRVGVRERLPTG